MATQSLATIDYKTVDNVGTLFIRRIPTKQSIEKVEVFLKSYGHETQRMVKKVMTVKYYLQNSNRENRSTPKFLPKSPFTRNFPPMTHMLPIIGN